MGNRTNLRLIVFSILLVLGIVSSSYGQNSILQNTHIRGFMDLDISHENGKVNFGFGEQDLFITSQLNDRFSFLGETVFKYTPTTPTEFSVSIERVIVKYNYYGNNNLLLGKQHTPINYWNMTYHHGRVFYPTIERPLLFPANFVPLHTTGIGAEGHDLGKVRFGYNFLVGNGIGAPDVQNNDSRVSVTAEASIKPVDNLRLGVSYYNDQIAPGADLHGRTIDWQVNQQLFTGSIAYFGRKFELLTEGTIALDRTDTTGTQQNWASYLYAGYKITDKLVPYIRIDNLQYASGEVYYIKNNTKAFLIGTRYYVDYLLVLKLEYQHIDSEVLGLQDIFTFQVALGF